MKIKEIPFSFILEEIESMAPYTKPMFGCYSIYCGDTILFICRQRQDHTRDNGVWLATTGEHHASLQKEFPSMRSIELFGPGPTGWQNLPEDAPDFEESVLRACKLVKKRDPRIGKIPARKKETQWEALNSEMKYNSSQNNPEFITKPKTK